MYANRASDPVPLRIVVVQFESALARSETSIEMLLIVCPFPKGRQGAGAPGMSAAIFWVLFDRAIEPGHRLLRLSLGHTTEPM
jgi:hypothetical protein